MANSSKGNFAYANLNPTHMDKKMLVLFVTLFQQALRKFGKKVPLLDENGDEVKVNGKVVYDYTTVFFGKEYQKILSFVKGDEMPHDEYLSYLSASFENGLVFKSFATGQNGKAFPIAHLLKPIPKAKSKQSKQEFDMKSYLTSRVKGKK